MENGLIKKTNNAMPQTKKNSLPKILFKYKELYILFLPVAIWFIVFHYIPMMGIVIAFKDYSIMQGIFDSPWAGLKHFERFLNSTAFLQTLKNTVLISLYNLVFSFPAPILFSLLLNEVVNDKFKKCIQTVSYLPHFISWSVAGGLFYMILSPSTGVINYFIKVLGFDAINFLGDIRYFRSILVVSGIWKSIGWGAIIYLAALSGVSEEMYEASYIDGAGRFRRIWHITLPSIRSVIIIMLILAVGNILNVGFEHVFVMINDTVLEVGETLDYYIYRIGLYNMNNFSFATAIGLFKSCIGFLLIMFTNVISKKIDEEGGIW